MRKKVFPPVGVLLFTIAFAASAPAQQFDESAERQLVQLINQQRARAGQPSFKVDDRLTQAARAHSALMAQAKQLSHQLPGEPKLSNRLAAAGVRFNNDAENVAYGYSVESAHDGLMHSPLHRENILSPKYNTVGVGVARSGDVLWVTENFAHRLEEYSVDQAENAIIAAWARERQQAKYPPAKTARVPRLRQIACAMAKDGQLDTRTPLSLANVESAVAYTASEPMKLPLNAMKKAHDRSVQRIAVGACFADGPQYPAGVWWVCMVFY